MADHPMEPFLLLLLLLSLPFEAAAASDCSNQICGNIPIPYPFTITPACGLPGYAVSCKQNPALGNGFFPFLSILDSAFDVLSFSAGSLIVNATHFRATSCSSSSPGIANLTIPTHAPFLISSQNIFAAIGCASWGNFSAFKDSVPFAGNCSNPCYNAASFSFCNAYSCCIVGLPQGGVKGIQIAGAGISYQDFPGVCGFSTVLDPDTFYLPPYSGYGFFGAGHYGISLSWGIPYKDKSASNCSAVKLTAAYECTAISECVEVYELPGYACNCSLDGYQGDGYKNGTGCENINECSNVHLNNCVGAADGGICTDMPGSYACSCKHGFIGDGYMNGTRCRKVDKSSRIILGTALSTGFGVSAVCILVWWGCRLRAARVRKDEYFMKNGGNRLRELMLTGHGSLTFTLFSESQLKKATNNFAEDLQLGRGGYGTVYKGFLLDGRTVAIKRSNHVDERQVDQFVNEVVILSNIKHRNIVKLLGCCLETPVPLLVYEYISNGNLSEHLEGKESRWLSWEKRLVIAHDSAEALAYLHSSISPPILHRDVKSSNILLDNNLTPKVSDFGISRILPTDETHVSTAVQGTLGYLDPEYFQTHSLTDKSDVYSFGVVLLELITSLKPIAPGKNENKINLATFCQSRWKAGTFFQAIDRQMLLSDDSEIEESIEAVASIALECLEEEGWRRPSMKSVSEWLRQIRRPFESNGKGKKGGHLRRVVDNAADLEEVEALLRKSSDFSCSTDDASSSSATEFQALHMEAPQRR